ncbi:hypothetical protein K3495_g4604 [Podosphaera aphanis]|nr:hypothetical protein K3495_g4604 [Podosphaera aphanis]
MIARQLLHSSKRYRCRQKFSCSLLCRSSSHNSSNKQAFPIGGYYLAILESSSSNSTSKANKANFEDSDISSTEESQSSPDSILVAFSTSFELPRSPLLSSRKIEPEIPHKPKEPDNCCMSGCVNCVWEIYTEDLEAWASAKKNFENTNKDVASSAPARDAQCVTNLDHEKSRSCVLPENTILRDKVKEEGSITEDELQNLPEKDSSGYTNELRGLKDHYYDLPVGIREFMKHEDRLKKKRSV